MAKPKDKELLKKYEALMRKYQLSKQKKIENEIKNNRRTN